MGSNQRQSGNLKSRCVSVRTPSSIPSQVEDYRGRGGRVPGGAPLALGGGGGIIGIIVLVAFLLLSGGGGLGDLGALEGQQVGPGQASQEIQNECRTGEDANTREDCRIVGVVNSVQTYWNRTLRNYEPARTRFFDGTIQTGCGQASSAVGPFYCPNDRNVYIDLGFFDQLQSQLGARGGPLAEAYVLAHEYGHHVQNLTGVLRSANKDTGPQGGQVPRRASGGLLRGALGRQRARHRLHRGADATGRRRCARRCRGGRRRPHPGARPGPRHPRVVDARLLGATAWVVHPRDRRLRPSELRHLPRPGLTRPRR